MASVYVICNIAVYANNTTLFSKCDQASDHWQQLGLRCWDVLRCWDWLSLLSWVGALTLSLLLKLSPRKLEPWFVLWSFFLLRWLCISINLPYDHACNTVVMSGLVLLQKQIYSRHESPPRIRANSVDGMEDFV